MKQWHPGPLGVVIRSSLIGGAIGGVLLGLIAFFTHHASASSTGAPGGYATVVGIFSAIVEILSTFPLNLLFTWQPWLVPLNTAFIGAVIGMIVVLTSRRNPD